MTVILLSTLSGYILGSIPTAYWLGRLVYSKNIFDHGSGSMGATNVYRVLGKVPFLITLFIDIFKGIAAVTVSAFFFATPSALFCSAVGALIGHTFSVFAGFKGGKGVATGLGIFIVLVPRASIVSLISFLIILFVFRMVSLSSIVAASVLPFAVVIMSEPSADYSIYFSIFSALVAAFVIFKHRANIKRILSGNEPRLNYRKKSDNSELQNQEYQSNDSDNSEKESEQEI